MSKKLDYRITSEILPDVYITKIMKSFVKFTKDLQILPNLNEGGKMGD